MKAELVSPEFSRTARDVPGLLFAVFGRKFGIGEDYNAVEHGVGYSCRALNPAEPLIGFTAAMGYREHSKQSQSLQLWKSVPAPGRKGPGLWLSDRLLFVESFWNEFEERYQICVRVEAGSPGMLASDVEWPFVARTLLIIHTLARNPSVSEDELWTGFQS